MSSERLELTRKDLLDIKTYSKYPEEVLFERAKKLKVLNDFKKVYLKYQKEKFISNNILIMNKVKLNGGEYKISNIDGVECITNFSGQVVTRTLVYPSLICVDLVSEQEEIELTFKKRSEWCSKKFPRSIFSSGSKIEKLASFGISVDINSKALLSKYLNDMLDLNIYKIPVKHSLNRLGWYEGVFVPFDKNIEVTGEENFDKVYKSIHQNGNFKVWLDEMYSIRKNVALRLVMATSFGSVMNEKLGKNGFVTHVWGGTGCGKTVALQVATSIWGDPSNGQYITKMNNTANFISRLAAFLYDMPTILDELETFSGDSKDLNELIMNLTEGIDRGKARKEGGVQDLKTWHNSFIFSGEHSISTDNLGGRYL